MHVKNVILGLLGLAAIVAAAPHHHSPDTCVPSISTVFATPSAIYITVTVHDVPASTVFVTVPSISYIRVSELPTNTLTRVSTMTSTTITPEVETVMPGGTKAVKSSPTYDTTVTETAVVTITVDLSKNTATKGPLSFIVVDGTTSWLGGQTPSPDEPYVYISSVITVVPVISDPAERTTILKSTVVLTNQVTITKTLAQSTSSVLIGTAGIFTAVPPGGWNVSTVAAGISGPLTAGAAPTSSSKPTLVTDEPTFDLYPTTTRTPIYPSSYVAQSGFKGYTTLTAPAIISSYGGWTTAVINGQTLSWTVPTSAASPSTLSAIPPYGNGTLYTSGSFRAPSSGLSTLNAITAGTFTSGSSYLTANSSGGGSFTISVSHNPNASYSGPTLTTNSSGGGSFTISASQNSNVSYSGPTLTAISSGNGTSGITTLTAISSGGGSFTLTVSNNTAAPSTTYSSQASTSLSYAASASPTKCGIKGDFTLTFDDIPPLAISNQSVDDVAPLPVFNPYHQFDFSDGFVVVPPPRVPYLPSSKPLLLEFIPNFTINRTDDESGPNAREFGWSGDIGNGDHGLTGCFSFNFYGASFGCDTRDADCIFTFSGFQYDRTTKLTSQVTTQTVPVSGCSTLNELDCALTPVTLDNTFQNLDIIRMNVTVGGVPKLWWMDDVRLGWYDNSCTKGLCRQSTKIH